MSKEVLKTDDFCLRGDAALLKGSLGEDPPLSYLACLALCFLNHRRFFPCHSYESHPEVVLFVKAFGHVLRVYLLFLIVP